MKKTLTLFIFILMSYTGFTQCEIPNASFEEWYYDSSFYGFENAVYWSSCPMWQESSTNAHWGQNALRFVIPHGTYQVHCIFYLKGKCNTNPKNLFGYYKSEPGEFYHNTGIEVFFTDTVSKLFISTTVPIFDSSRIYGYGKKVLKDTTGIYSEFSVEVNFTDTSRSDSFVILLWPNYGVLPNIYPFEDYDFITYYDDLSFSSKSSIAESPQNIIQVFPNPFSDKTQIRFSNPDHQSYQFYLYDLSGKVVLVKQNITGEKFEIVGSNIASGIYIAELRGDQILQTKLSVQ